MIRSKLIIKIVVLLVVVAGGWFYFTGAEEVLCVQEQCFHATSCVPESEAPDCSGLFGTQECEPDTLDCGQGYCKYSKLRRSCVAILESNV